MRYFKDNCGDIWRFPNDIHEETFVNGIYIMDTSKWQHEDDSASFWYAQDRWDIVEVDTKEAFALML